MERRRHKREEIVVKPWQVQVVNVQGSSVAEAAQRIAVRETMHSAGGEGTAG